MGVENNSVAVSSPRLTGLKRIESTKGRLISEMPGCVEANMFAILFGGISQKLYKITVSKGGVVNTRNGC